jgi:PKD domain
LASHLRRGDPLTVARGTSLIRLTLVSAVMALAAVAFAGLTASAALGADCNHKVFDGSGYFDDFEATPVNAPSVQDEYGSVDNGGSNGPVGIPPGPVESEDSYDDWGDVFVYSPFADLLTPTAENKYDGAKEGCSFSLGGQEIVYPVDLMQGLDVQHRWFVDPGPAAGARILTVLHNPGGSPISVTVVQGDPSGYDDLGSDSLTASRATSDGSNVFSSASFWGVSSDSATLDEDPALAHVWDGPGGAMRASEVVLGNGNGADVLFWAWKNVTVPPGGTNAFISYEIQQAVPGRSTSTEVSQAVARAQGRETQSFASLYTGMSAAEIAGTLNWAHPQPTATIAAVNKPNAATAVTLNGSGSVAAAGLPQCSLAYAWKADDGATGSTATFSHLFTSGTHHASLTVTNNCGGAPAVSEVAFKVANGFKLGKVKANPKAGTAMIKVKVLGPGTLSLKGKGVKKLVKKVKKAGNVNLIVKPTGKTLKTLTSAGKAKVKITVSLTPNGGKASKQAKSVNLKLIG